MCLVSRGFPPVSRGRYPRSVPPLATDFRDGRALGSRTRLAMSGRALPGQRQRTRTLTTGERPTAGTIARNLATRPVPRRTRFAKRPCLSMLAAAPVCGRRRSTLPCRRRCGVGLMFRSPTGPPQPAGANRRRSAPLSLASDRGQWSERGLGAPPRWTTLYRRRRARETTDTRVEESPSHR